MGTYAALTFAAADCSSVRLSGAKNTHNLRCSTNSASKAVLPTRQSIQAKVMVERTLAAGTHTPLLVLDHRLGLGCHLTLTPNHYIHLMLTTPATVLLVHCNTTLL